MIQGECLQEDHAVPRIRYVVTMSLDGYIAGPQGEVDWIVSEPAIDSGRSLPSLTPFWSAAAPLS